MIRLVPLSIHPVGFYITWELLQERPESAFISHIGGTAQADHNRYVRSMPYRVWEIIENEEQVPVGAVYLTNRNEVGIAILQAHQGKGYATQAIKAVMAKYAPLAPIPGDRTAHYVANVAPTNTASQKLFEKLGAKLVQYTFKL